MSQIVAATDFSTRSQRALRRAGRLARQTAAALTLVHVGHQCWGSDADRAGSVPTTPSAASWVAISEPIGSRDSVMPNLNKISPSTR
jgi:nucleotide-binding universal stress UspA family protein